MKKKRAVNRLLSVILAMIMIFELLPAELVVQAGRTGSGTEEDPVVVHTFQELKEAMESDDDLYIRVDEVKHTTGRDCYLLQIGKDYTHVGHAINVPSGTKKYLEVNCDIKCVTPSIQGYYEGFIKNNGDLTIYGNGKIASNSVSNYHTRAVIYNNGGKLTVLGNVSIEGIETEAVEDDGARAIFADGGTVDIRGGYFTGVSLEYLVGAAIAISKKVDSVTISGGVFDKSEGSDNALCVEKGANLKISGGTFNEIESVLNIGINDYEKESGEELSQYLEAYCAYNVNGVQESGEGLTKLSGEVGILNDEIPAIDISLEIPMNGNKPAEPVVTTKDVKLVGSVSWVCNDMDQVSWGEEFEAGEKYGVAFSVEPVAGSGRHFVNGTVVRVNSKEVTVDAGSNSTHFDIHQEFIATPGYIRSTNANVEVPKDGATPKDAVTDTAHVKVTQTEWKNKSTGVTLKATDTFVLNETYAVFVTVAADKGYRISDNPEGTFNSVIEGVLSYKSEAYYTYYTEYEVVEENTFDVIVNVDDPVHGAKPADAVSETEHVTVTDTQWKYAATGVVLSPDETFKEGEFYTVNVKIKADEGYTFIDNTNVHLNGRPVSNLTFNDTNDEISFYALMASKICTINVNLTEPEAGAKPSNAISTTDNVTVTDTEWKDETTNTFLTSEDSFINGHTYRVGVIVEDESGCGFSSDPNTTFNNTTKGIVYLATRDAVNFYTSYTIGAYKIISQIDAVVVTPVAGANPKDAICKTPNVSVESTVWKCLDNGKVLTKTDTFEEGKTYQAWIAVETATGYTLPNNVALTLNNNIAAEMASWSPDGTQASFIANFEVGKTISINAIDAVVITPVAGANPKDAICITPYITFISTIWVCIDDGDKVVTATDTFEAGKKYRVMICAEAADGYFVAKDAIFTINKSIIADNITWDKDWGAWRAEFTAEVKELDSLSIDTEPSKTTYNEGETFDPSGMIVTAKYSDNSTQDVTAYCTYTPDGALTLADKEITVSYTEGGVTKTAKQAITVKGLGVKKLSSIAVTTAPVKTTYSAGETFDPAGMVVTATYDDKSTGTVSTYTYEPTTALAASDTEVTISYTEGGITATAKQPITVIDKNDSLYVTFTEGDSFVYTGDKITPAVAVMYRGKALVEGVDYTVKYKNNVKASEGASKLPTVTVTGKTVAASGSRTFTITRKDIDDPDVTAAGITVAKGKTASPTVFYAGRKLGKNDINNPDAKVKFETDGTITIEGKGNFTGKRTIDVKVVDEKKIQVTAFNPVERIYNGLEQPLAASELTVVSGLTTLELGKDFEINYPADIASAGTVKITIVGIGEYSGSVSKSYKISPCTAGINVDVPASVQYKAGGATPVVTVTNGTDKLIAGRDYTLKYSNNKAANGKKPASVKVTFKGSYKGAAAVTKDFSITALDISTAMPKICGDEKAYIKSGKYLKAPYVEVNGALLTAKDMDVTYKIDGKDAKAGDKITDDMMSAGKITVEVTVSGKGNYTGTVIGSYTISKAEKNQDISKAGVKLDKKSYAFTGENLKPVVTVQIGKGANAVTLKEGVDYKVEYFANVNKGKGTIVITGLGDSGTGTSRYYGSKKVSFKIDKGIFNWL